MKRLTYRVTLRLRGPILTKSSSIGAPGVDAVMAQRQFNGQSRYYLPGSLVKGLLREAWQELGEVDPAYKDLPAAWLGQISPTDNSPQRARLYFSDLPDLATEPVRKLRQRIQIDEKRGAASAQMLQVLESPYRPGQEVEFTGDVRMFVTDDQEGVGLADQLHRGLLWIRAAGGVRTSGFGGLIDATVSVSAPVAALAHPTGASDVSPRWAMRLTFNHPLILSKLRVADNLFESGEVISGGALKGAVAEMLARSNSASQALRDELHAVRFSHAFPAAIGQARPVQWPLSLLHFRGSQQPEDAIRATGAYSKGEAFGAFDIDWKEDTAKAAANAFGWPKVERELRVRTQIDGQLGRAKDQRLFAWRMLKPDGVQWVSEVEASPLSPLARQQLWELLQLGIEPIGKTKAFAAVTLVHTVVPPVIGTDYVVTLQTPALLIDPSRHLAPGGTLGTGDAAKLREEFLQVWTDLSDGSLQLVTYYQRMTLAGGEYLQRRFSRPAGYRPYKPYLLSDPGSTFLLKPVPGRESEAQAKVESWRRDGLPLSASVQSFYGIPAVPATQWQHCPYLPQNGYGEIAVNHRSPDHLAITE